MLVVFTDFVRYKALRCYCKHVAVSDCVFFLCVTNKVGSWRNICFSDISLLFYVLKTRLEFTSVVHFLKWLT